MSVLQLHHPWADAVILCVLGAAGLVAGFRRHPRSLVLLAVAVVLSAFWVPAGTKLGALEIVPLSILAGSALGAAVRRGRLAHTMPVPKMVVLAFAGLGAAAALSSWLAPDAPPGGPGGLQSPAIRPFVQAGSYGLLLLFFLIPNWISVGTRHLRSLSRGFQMAVGVSAVYGLYQLLAFRARLPFRGIQYFGGEGAREGFGIMSVAGIRLFRMSGFANEPKQLAAVAIVAFVMALFSVGLYRRGYSRWILLALSGVAFVGAWSTGGLLAAALVLIAGLVWMLRTARDPVNRGLQIGTSVVLVVVAVVVLSGQTVHAMEIVRDVAVGRVQLPFLAESAGAGQRIENAVIDHFWTHPLSLVTGLGLGHYPFVVGEPGQWVWAGGIQPMHSLPLTLLADFGLVPLVLLGGVLLKVGSGPRFPWITFDDRYEGGSPYQVVQAGVVASLLVSTFVNLLPLVLLFLGVLYSYQRQIAGSPQNSTVRRVERAIRRSVGSR